MEGSYLKDYELLCKLAAGGMAQLFLARKRGIGRFEKLLAIKQILPEFANQADFVRMFLDEARIAATLQHPNNVPVYHVDSDGGQVFLVMEFLHGHDLRKIFSRAKERSRPIDLAPIVGVGVGACAGLHYAHEQLAPDGAPLAIVHRDVSPHNVFVTFDGIVKVIDFGIAKAADRLDKTSSTSLKGKLGYMSPEQVRGEPLDRRSDVFSIAIVLHELLTGRRLFGAKSDYETLRAVVDAELPAPSTINPAVPPALDRIVLKGLARDRAERYASALALQDNLEALARAESLNLSSQSLRAFMAAHFDDEVRGWREAQLQGKRLAEHLLETGRAQPVEPRLQPQEIERAARELGASGDAGTATATSSDAQPIHARSADRPRRRLTRPALFIVASGLVTAGLLAAFSLTRPPSAHQHPAPIAAPIAAAPVDAPTDPHSPSIVSEPGEISTPALTRSPTHAPMPARRSESHVHPKPPAHARKVSTLDFDAPLPR